jgi:hypothetical protein
VPQSFKAPPRAGGRPIRPVTHWRLCCRSARSVCLACCVALDIYRGLPKAWGRSWARARDLFSVGQETLKLRPGNAVEAVSTFLEPGSVNYGHLSTCRRGGNGGGTHACGGYSRTHPRRPEGWKLGGRSLLLGRRAGSCPWGRGVAPQPGDCAAHQGLGGDDALGAPSTWSIGARFAVGVDPKRQLGCASKSGCHLNGAIRKRERLEGRGRSRRRGRGDGQR